MSEEKRRELFCGVDLHSTNGVYHIDDKGGECVFHRRLANRPDIALKAMEPFKDDLVSVAIESTYNWHWLGDALIEQGYPVVLAHPAASLEDYVLNLCKPRAEYAILTSAPGIGKILAMVIMMEIGDISRFPSPGHLSSYVRAVKASRISNGKAKGTNNGRNGNKYLSWAFIEAVNHAIRHCAPARKWYQKKVAKTLPVVGRKALASKWSKAVWYMLTEKKPFQVELVFG